MPWGRRGTQASYEEFCALFPPTDCRYGVYDYDYTDSEGCQKSKIVFFAWCAEQPAFPPP
jgi:cofilin